MDFMTVPQFIGEQRNNNRKQTKTYINHLLHVMGRNTTTKNTIPDWIRHSFHIVLEGSLLGRLSSNQ